VKLLLDTSSFIFACYNQQRLSPVAKAALTNPENIICVSAIVAFEVAIKQSINKLDAFIDPVKAVQDQDFRWIPITAAVYPILRDLPPHHRDPFDRLLIAQAIAEGFSLVSGDRNIARYAVSVMW
jgi:PIN domain nuclease of toxin-antitoxin system